MAFPSVTYSFTNGTAADANQVNTNFSDLISGASDGTKDYNINALAVNSTLAVTAAATFAGNVTLGNAAADATVVSGTLSVAAAATFSSTVTISTGASSGYVLVSDSSGGATWRGGAGKKVYRSVTTTDSPTATDDVLACSGASFTITLPSASASANVNKVFEIIHLGTTLTQAYTLNTTSSQTIGGVASGSYILYTNGERLKIISDGSNWQILFHNTITAFVAWDPGNTPQGFGTISNKSFFWRRNGENMEAIATFTAGTVSGSEAQIPLPNSVTISSILSTKKAIPSWWRIVSGTSHGGAVIVTPGDAFLNFSDSGVFGNASVNPLTEVNGSVMLNNGDAVGFACSFPIAGWQP